MIAFDIAGVLYVRVDGKKTEEVAAGSPFFGGLSSDGRYLYYEQSGDIHRFDTGDEADEAVNSSGDAQMMNASDDGSHVYFISPSQLDGGNGVNGEPNIYLWDGGTPEFVATVADEDLEGNSALGQWLRVVAVKGVELNTAFGPGVEASRVSSDGTVVIFESSAKLTSYENAGHREIYRRVEGQPVECVSCNPAATPAVSGARLENVSKVGAMIYINNLSADGSRIFFETDEALVAGDDDGINDVYEWRFAPGASEPEVGLISSGHSFPFPLRAGEDQNSLYAIAENGADVYFKSQDALVPGAGIGGVPAIYDAKIDGGLPPPPPAPAPCAGESCRPPVTPAPLLGAASSLGFQGAGNVKPKKAKHRRKHRRCARRPGGRSCAKHRVPASSWASDLASTPRDTLALASVEPDQEKAAAETNPSPFGPGAAAGAAAPTAVATAAAAEFAGYGVESVAGALSSSAAAQHPDFTTALHLNRPEHELNAHTKDVAVNLPPGFYGNPNLVPRCAIGDFLAEACPIDSQIGVSDVKWIGINDEEGGPTLPLFNLAPTHPDREVARLGFIPIQGLAVFIDVSIRTAGDYGITAVAHSAPSLFPLVKVETTVWGDPADPSHNKLRMTTHEAINCEPSSACEAPGGERAPEELGPVAFWTNPSACGQGSLDIDADSYQLPGQVFSKSALMPPITNCTGLPFSPSQVARPTSDVAGAPTGLKTELTLPQTEGPGVPSTATMREVKVILPEGLTINPSAADGLAACSDAQVHFHEELDQECPNASKLGSATITSPALARPLEGALYQRSPGGRGDQFRLWLVTDELGLHVKIPAVVKPDPDTGRVTAVFAELPQVPVEKIATEIWGGARAPLMNPSVCGEYETTSVITPWSSDPPVTSIDHYLIDRSSDGSACPPSAGQERNAPEFQAGTVTPVSGLYSPFVLRLSREDGSQNFGSLDVTLPPGLVGKLAGVAECADAALAAAGGKSGVEEERSPSCPEASQIGRVRVAAGAGPSPFWAQGRAYLAGPYQGAPLSVAIVTPAVAGPFDLGTVVVRSPLFVDPLTAQITVKAGPLPRILEGVPLDIRTIAVEIDRSQFTLNGTSCEPLAFAAAETSTLGHIAPLTARFQLAECARLAFGPKLSLRLKGPTKRTSHPILIANLAAKAGQANIAAAQVKLPRSAFLDQSHIGTVCTRVQFAADQCPARSVYGRVSATSPLLDYPLGGPVYLRSSDHELPDLVAKLKGPAAHPLEIDLDGKVDSVHGAIRNTFETVPDVPVGKFHLELFGGHRGLIELTSGLCKDPRARIKFTGQNGRVAESAPAVKTSCSKHTKKPKDQHKKKNRRG